jgi:RNA polymerase sigma-70 factor, ECF subfamily
MISAFRRAGSFRGDSAVTTWLHRIVVNACLDRMRRRSARPTAGSGDEEVLDSLASGRAPLSDPSGTTDTQLDVMAALRRLVPDQQAALVLVDMLGYSVADAAQVLGVSEGTVKSRAARGRARLLPALSHLRPQGGGSQTPANPPVPGSGEGSPAEPDPDHRNRSGGPHVLPAQEGGEDSR